MIVAVTAGDACASRAAARTPSRRRRRGSPATSAVWCLGSRLEVARRGHGDGAQAADVLDQPRGQAAHQRDEQQHIDGGEPEAGEHVEGLQPVQPRPDGRMLGDVLLDLGLVEAALRQQGAGDGAEREQEQQHQRGAHRRQRAPGVAHQREQTRKPPKTPVLGCLSRPARGEAVSSYRQRHVADERVAHPGHEVVPHSGHQRGADQDQQHAAEDLDAPGCARRSQPRPCTARAEPKANSTNGIPRPRQ